MEWTFTPRLEAGDLQDPNVLEVKHGGGCFLTLFGLPFFAAGVFCLISPWLSLNWEGGEPPPLYFIIPFGSIFAIVGGALMFGRAGVVIDARRRVATTWWGFLVPFKRKEIALSSDMKVTLTKERRKSDNSSYWVYPVKIEGDFETVAVEEKTDWFKARQRSEQIGKLLGFPVIDTSQAQEVVLDPEDLDKPLKERIRESGVPADLPSPPPGYRTRLEMLPNGVRFDIPPSGFSILHIFQLMGLGVLYVIISLFFRNFLEGLEGRELLIFGSFASLFYLIPGIGVASSLIRDLTFSSCVAADPNQLEVTHKYLLFNRTKRMRISEIEDVTVHSLVEKSPLGKALPGKRHIVVVSGREHFRFGQGLDLEEMTWVANVIRYLIAKA